MGLLDCDWRDPRVGLAVATGCHAPPTGPELEAIFGEHLPAVHPRVHVHRIADPAVPVGVTARGTPVEIDPCLETTDAVVCLGSVEPHYFAGWTGGRKSVVPGLCSLATLRANHRLALDPAAAVGSLAGNPLHLDLEEATALVRDRIIARGGSEPLAVNAVVLRGAVHAWRCGPLLGAIEALAARGWEVFGREIPGPAPLVICFVDHPLDRDLYQALKAFEHWKSAVGPGGAIVLVADCPEGIGPATFTQFVEGRVDLAATAHRARADYRLGDHKLLNFQDFLASGRQVHLASTSLAGCRGLPMPVSEALSDSLAAALRSISCAEGRALVIEDAATLAPRYGARTTSAGVSP
jgi:nickel-dependent lactate racemase